jgi:hypothetical protein
MRLPLPSAVLPGWHDGGQASALRLARVRAQVAIIRTLADHVETLSRAGEAGGIADQLIEEMARLGCSLLETAGALAAAPPLEDSGVFARVEGLAAQVEGPSRMRPTTPA